MNTTVAGIVATVQPVFNWVAAHPIKAVFHTLNGVIILIPAVVTAPIFAAFGLTALGPAPGTLPQTQAEAAF